MCQDAEVIVPPDVTMEALPMEAQFVTLIPAGMGESQTALSALIAIFEFCLVWMGMLSNWFMRRRNKAGKQ